LPGRSIQNVVETRALTRALWAPWGSNPQPAD
jgi:hypothetical protein